MKDFKRFDNRYTLIFTFSFAQIIFGLTQNSLTEIINGLIKIISLPSTLITDYIELANMNVAFINSGLVTLACLYLLHRIKQELTGPIIDALFLVDFIKIRSISEGLNVGYVHSGLYFYNYGFVAGLSADVLILINELVRNRTKNKGV